MIISPYTIENKRSPRPDIPWRIAEKLAKEAGTQPNKKAMVVRSNMYPVDGTDQDWLYHEHGTLAYIVEGSHHNPRRRTVREASIEGVRPIFKGLLEVLATSPLIYGNVTGPEGGPLEAVVRIKGARIATREGVDEEREFVFFEGERWTSRPRDGRYQRIVLEPGEYSLHYSKDGYKSELRTLKVGAGPVELNVELHPENEEE